MADKIVNLALSNNHLPIKSSRKENVEKKEGIYLFLPIIYKFKTAILLQKIKSDEEIK
jgi:hypothetical protein